MTMPGMLIDSMREDDVPAILAIQLASFPASGEPPDVIERLVRIEEQQLREEFSRPWARLWVVRAPAWAAPASATDASHAEARLYASDGGDEIAIAFLLSWHVVDELHILNVATHPAHRRRGIGRALMSHAIEYARSRQGRLVLLEVRRSNHAAIALYRSLFFFAMTVRSRYYSDGEDAIEMGLRFDPQTGQRVEQGDEVIVENEPLVR